MKPARELITSRGEGYKPQENARASDKHPRGSRDFFRVQRAWRLSYYPNGELARTRDHFTIFSLEKRNSHKIILSLLYTTVSPAFCDNKFCCCCFFFQNFVSKLTKPPSERCFIVLDLALTEWVQLSNHFHWNTYCCIILFPFSVLQNLESGDLLVYFQVILIVI